MEEEQTSVKLYCPYVHYKPRYLGEVLYFSTHQKIKLKCVVHGWVWLGEELVLPLDKTQQFVTIKKD